MLGDPVRRATLLLATLALATAPLPADIAGAPSRVVALVNARVVVRPGASPVDAAIVIRDGRISAVGAGSAVPADAVVHDLAGRIVYAGFIEPYLRLPSKDAKGAAPREGEKVASVPEPAPGAPIPPLSPKVRAEVRAVDLLPLPAKLSEELRGAGFTVALVAPDRGAFRGSCAVVDLATPAGDAQVVASDVAMAFGFDPAGWDDGVYPASLMGMIALARQSFLDARWHRDAWAAYRRDPRGHERPPRIPALQALEPVVAGKMPLLLESEDVNMLPRALAVAKEAGAPAIIVSGGSDEYRRLDDAKRWLGSAQGLILTVAFPRVPRWDEEDQAADVELEDLIRWERAPGNPAALHGAGVAFATSTQGLPKRGDVHERLRLAISNGLPAEVALAALTTEPARLLGLSERMGSVEVGKDANLVVATGELFAPDSEIEQTFIRGVRHGDPPRPAEAKDLKGSWALSLPGEATPLAQVAFDPSEGKLTGKVVEPKRAEEAAAADAAPTPAAGSGSPAPEDDSKKLRDVRLALGVLTFTIPASAGVGPEAAVRLVRDGKLLRGTLTAGGAPRDVVALRVKEPKKEKPREMLAASAPRWPPVAGRDESPEAVVVRDATIWTMGPGGIVAEGDLLVKDGKVVAVGRDLAAPAGSREIDGKGRHVTPGLIDCHSHSDIAGDVNEATHSATSEVRIGDVIHPDSAAMYRELAGGLTVSNLLHGSANVIGGQNAVVKLRWGLDADGLRFEGAPQGIKFALGENVKQSNWGDKYVTRYPQTRMGVEQFLRERFAAALDARRAANVGEGQVRLPRRDLQLEALLEIVDGKRLVHCHSYRSDEIIMMMRVAESLGFHVATFQHVLEGYKCADELARHGAGASTFSDWWSYKYEVVDAIPYNAEIMWRRGVLVSFNSDSSELSRRLNLEAAKAVKYGGVPEEDALAMVTRNPAKQLRIDGRVGSLEPGKDGDFVVWSGHPLADASVCEETWIEGVRRFSRTADAAARAAAVELRGKLVDEARAAWDLEEPGDGKSEQGSAFGRLVGALSEHAGCQEEEP